MMSAVEFAVPVAVPVPARRRIRFRRFLLTPAQARSWRRCAAGLAIVMVLAGWVESFHEWHHTYDVVFGWSALVVYLAPATLAQLLTIVPLFTLEA